MASSELRNLKKQKEEASDDSLFHFVKNPICHFELLDLANGDDMDLLSLVPSFVFPNLKNVKIVISPKRCLKDHVEWGFDKLFNLLKFLLKNATVLEEFVILSKRRM
ncbi:hypothetical protein HAX54_046410 [Datura stramonium]|uniref:FBD domain-containing protein n=1 Tax=Datura stramonium TaxID=4076 RepID=A0ABS8SS15_DATST|nr:hypothetical protein [Datura stramonium]